MSKNYTPYLKLSETQPWLIHTIETVREVAIKNKEFTSEDVVSACKEKNILLPDGRSSVGIAVRKIHSDEYGYVLRKVKRVKVSPDSDSHLSLYTSNIYGDE